MRAVVTGGAGFIGSHVVDALVERGDEVTVVDNLSSGKRENLNPAARFVEADIRDGLDVQADVIFHLAAQADVNTSVQRPDYDADVNVRGTVRVLEAARENGAQVIFSSTGGAIYGECERPAREDDPRRPMSPYGIAKLAGEEYLQGWNRMYGADHVVLRFANVYGSRQDSGLEGGVVAIFLERMHAGQKTAIYGDGLQTRDFVDVGDIVGGLLAAVGREGGVFNLGTGRETTVREIHELCRRVSGSIDEPTIADARVGDVQRSVLDATRAREELGWSAEPDLEPGFRRIWEWMQST